MRARGARHVEVTAGKMRRSLLERVAVTQVAQRGKLAIGPDRVAGYQHLAETERVDRLPGFIGDTRCLINDHQHVPRVVAARSLNGRRGKPKRTPTRPDCRCRRRRLDAGTDRHRQETGFPEWAVLNRPADLLEEDAPDLGLPSPADIDKTMLSCP